MIVVSDTSPIINLAAIGHLEVLRDLYGQVHIPDAVYEELTVDEQQPGAAEASIADWIVQRATGQNDLTAALLGEMDRGEAAAIALAVEMHADLLLIDERIGRAAATRLGIHRIGVLGVLLEAKGQSIVPSIRPLLDALRAEAGFWVSDALYARVLDVAGET
ncbi:MAG: DUF3368 domain-containing protein [Bacteroidetes bacterium]|nr:DUF3368 domain-containing protein [Bacteroidota bacterium]